MVKTTAGFVTGVSVPRPHLEGRRQESNPRHEASQGFSRTGLSSVSARRPAGGIVATRIDRQPRALTVTVQTGQPRPPQPQVRHVTTQRPGSPRECMPCAAAVSKGLDMGGLDIGVGACSSSTSITV